MALPPKRPPWERLSGWLARLVPERYRDDVMGDLLEEHAQVVLPRRGRLRAGAWLAVRTLAAAAAIRWFGLRARLGRTWRSGAAGIATDTRARENARGGAMEHLVQDVRFALRTWRRAPLFTAAVLATLGAGMGLTLAVFSVVSGVLVRPLDYPDPDRLVHVQGQRAARFGVSMPVHLTAVEGSSLVESASAWQGWGVVSYDGEGLPVRRSGASVSAEFFDLLGARPAAGRLFRAEDDEPGHPPVAVLSHALWQQEYGGREDVVGGLVRFSDASYEIVGVAPAGFVDPVTLYLGWSQPQLWRAHPPGFDAAREDRGWVGFWSLARLRAGASLEDFRAELLALLDDRFGPPENPWEVRAVTFKDAVVEDVRPTLAVLLVAVIGVLLIACGNVANLLLSRASVRAREIAVRSSLGAARGRVVRQLFTESLLLALAAALLGLAASVAGTAGLVRMAAGELPRADAVGLDGRVLAFALLAAAGTAVLFGLVPALRVGGQDASAALRGGGRPGTSGRRGHAVRSSLLVAQTALSMVLLVSAGLLVVTLRSFQSLNPGFDPAGALVVPVGLMPERYPEPALQDQAVARIARAASELEGVRAAGIITDLPLSGAVNSTRVLRVGESAETAPPRPGVLVRAIDPGYLEAMGIALRGGRPLSPSDVAGVEEVAVVNESFARLFFPEGAALGATVVVRGVERTIVAVAADVREFTLADGGDPVLYTPWAQERESWMRSGFWLVVRGGTAPARLAAALHERVRSVEPGATLGPCPDAVLPGGACPLASFVDRQVVAPRLRATLLVLFATLAVFLTAVGLGGVTAHGVAQRVPEIGLRLALGAQRLDVQAMVMRRSLILVGAGLALGLAGALAASRSLEAFLFGVDAREPAVFAGVALLLGGIGLVASWLPARRAARVDPAVTLRQE